MKLTEFYYGPVRLPEGLAKDPSERGLYDASSLECYIKVNVNGRSIHHRSVVDREIPHAVVLRAVRSNLMKEIEKELFGGIL